MTHLALLTPEWYAEEGGGIGTYCRILAQEADALGHEVTVIAATQRARPRVALRNRTQLIPIAIDRRATALEAAGAFRDAWRTYARDADVIEAAEFGGAASLVAEEHPVITRLHTPLALLLERYEGASIYRDDEERCELEARQVRSSIFVTSPTAWLAREAARLWNVRAEVIPNPVRRPAAMPRARTASAPLRVLYFGRLEYRKGVLTIVEAARPLIASGSIELTFVGGDTKWLGDSMRARIERALEPHRAVVLAPEYGERLSSIVEDADVVVLPSRFENFSYACVEAMGRARCVIATSGSGFDEIIDDGRTGLLVPPGDSVALRNAIAACASGVRDCAEIGRAAWESLARFDAAAVTQRLCSAYEKQARNHMVSSRR